MEHADQAHKHHVDDQDKAPHFYTEVLGFAKKSDVPAGEYRWLTVVSPEGLELVLEPNDNPAAKTYQQALHEQDIPAAVFHTNDLQREYDRLAGLGVKFTAPMTKEAWGSMAVLDDTLRQPNPTDAAGPLWVARGGNPQ